jgi:parallel beta-helix repeat protein
MNKKVLILFFICFISIFLISAVSASDADNSNQTTTYKIKSSLSNDEIQAMFDNANDGDTFELTSYSYRNVSLVVDKKINIVSNKSATVYASTQVSDKAKSMGITETFGFYFTSNSAGSILSGIRIIADSCDNAIIVDGADEVTIKDSRIVNGENSILIKNSQNVTLSNNDISKATKNGIQLQNVKYASIINNNIHNNGRSGIETSNLYNCKLLRNNVHHNGFNGISMYGVSENNVIKYNTAHNNTNGIYIDCKTTNDTIMANTFSHNRNDPFCELGGAETGNGLLFGEHFRTPNGNGRLLVKNNALIHNENFQAKNNPLNEVFKLDQNYFDSTDGEDTFICPMLLAKILKLDTITIQNGIGIQLQDENGNPITDAPAFDLGEVEVNGNKYTARMENDGIAKIQSKDLEPNTDYKVKYTVGDRIKKEFVKTAKTGSEKYEPREVPSSSNNENYRDDEGSDDEPQNQNTDSSNSNGNGNGNGNYVDGTSSSSHISNGDSNGKYGTNSSDVISSDSTDNGENVMSQGDVNAGSSSEGSGEAANAYEIVPETPISKKVDNTSGLVVISILFLLGCLVYGYKRRSNFE